MRYFLVLIVLLLVSCASIKVNYDYDENTDFSQYKTYNYYSDIKTGLSELDTKRLFNALDEALQNQGFTLSDSPDFFIDIQSSEYQETNRNSVGLGVGGSGRNVGGGISIGIPVKQDNVNRIIQFDFVDESGIGLFWQAVSESSFNPKATPEQRNAQLQSIVEKVLKGFPPK